MLWPSNDRCDDFRAYNDTCGHLAGDHALTSIAKTIRAACRGSDEAFRYDGEEIALLLPGTPPHGLVMACARLLHHVETLAIRHKSHITPHLTVRVGGVNCYGHESSRARRRPGRRWGR